MYKNANCTIKTNNIFFQKCQNVVELSMFLEHNALMTHRIESKNEKGRQQSQSNFERKASNLLFKGLLVLKVCFKEEFRKTMIGIFLFVLYQQLVPVRYL